MADSKNVDDILIPREQAMLNNQPIPSASAVMDEKNEDLTQKDDDKAVEQSDKDVPRDDIELEKQELSDDESASNVGKVDKEPEKVDKAEQVSPIDEYGNPIEKSKMYSEEEVNRMMRERFSRGKYAEQAPQVQQQIQKDAQGFQPDPASDESWETQLEAFIERTVDKRQAKLSEQQWRAQEAAKHAEFEDKFTIGMSKYHDFHKVVSGQPITNDMLLATRSLENPAAFVYGASKLHPKELDRISRMQDPYMQAAEVGRLHERMVKERRSQSAAPKPLDAPKGSLPNKAANQPSIDERIHQYAKQKRK